MVGLVNISLFVYRFTEFFVDEPQSTSDLALLVMSYLKSTSPSAALVDGIIR